jgi:hypothetical protein
MNKRVSRSLGQVKTQIAVKLVHVRLHVAITWIELPFCHWYTYDPLQIRDFLVIFRSTTTSKSSPIVTFKPMLLTASASRLLLAADAVSRRTSLA